MANKEVVKSAIQILQTKGNTGGHVEQLNRSKKLDVLNHGPCPGCTHLEIEIKLNHSNPDRASSVRLDCEESNIPQRLIVDGWMPIDKSSKCLDFTSE